MDHVSPFPELLAARYRTWREDSYRRNRKAYAALAADGQAPRTMIISCCDSRVLVPEMFGAAAGDYFVHRNIAALVPGHADPEGVHGTLSTVEYAVVTLGVRHILVIGHSGCGGIAAADALFDGRAPALEDPASYVGRWLRILAPACAAVRHIAGTADRRAALEREAVRLSLGNLAALPFVAAALREGRLELHGAWKNIADGALEALDPATDAFHRL